MILQPCGTDAAYARHIRRREPVDEACQEAHRHYGRVRYSIKFLAKSRLRGPRYQALEALIHRHRAEYAELYAKALREAADYTAEKGAA